MSHKRRQISEDYSSSQSQLSDIESQSQAHSDSSSVSSSSSSSSSRSKNKYKCKRVDNLKEKYNKKLSKKDIVKLIKLEQAIQKQKRLLKKLKKYQSSKSGIKKLPKKQLQVNDKVKQKQSTSLSSYNSNINNYSLNKNVHQPYPNRTHKHNHNPAEYNNNYSTYQKHRQDDANYQQGQETKKLFITGIQDKYSFEQVTNEFNRVLSSYPGLVGFRIKRKQGCPTYAFIDFEDKEMAKQAMDRLRKTKIFGLKIAIYYSQDQQKQYPRMKKCYKCNVFGHLTKDCQVHGNQYKNYNNYSPNSYNNYNKNKYRTKQQRAVQSLNQNEQNNIKRQASPNQYQGLQQNQQQRVHSEDRRRYQKYQKSEPVAKLQQIDDQVAQKQPQFTNSSVLASPLSSTQQQKQKVSTRVVRDKNRLNRLTNMSN